MWNAFKNIYCQLWKLSSRISFKNWTEWMKKLTSFSKRQFWWNLVSYPGLVLNCVPVRMHSQKCNERDLISTCFAREPSWDANLELPFLPNCVCSQNLQEHSCLSDLFFHKVSVNLRWKPLESNGPGDTDVAVQPVGSPISLISLGSHRRISKWNIQPDLQLA